MTGGALLDALGRPVPLEPRPLRLLSLVPSVTECLFDAGLGERVVGRTRYCISPAQAARLSSVGGPKSVNVDRAVALAPDLVLANAEENSRGQVEALIDRGLRVHVGFPRTLADVAAYLRDLGLLTGCAEPFEAFARGLEAVGPAPGPPVPCACLVWKNPYISASGDTLTSTLLEAAGGQNVFGNRAHRYPTLTQEDLAFSGARVVLLPSEPYEFSEADARGVEALVPGAAAVRVQGEWLTWYGSRMTQAIEGLRAVLRPFR